MRGSDLIIGVVCGVIVFCMGILAWWSENGGKDGKKDQLESSEDEN